MRILRRLSLKRGCGHGFGECDGLGGLDGFNRLGGFGGFDGLGGFDCLLHSLLITKLHAYGFDKTSKEYLKDYLSHRPETKDKNK